MLIDRLLAQIRPGAAGPLFRQMDDNYATILRQAFFAIFEKEAHARVAEGASVDALSKLYRETLREQFGDAVELTDDFGTEWLAIPHIYHTPFYVYAYAFGQLLVPRHQQLPEEGRYPALPDRAGFRQPMGILKKRPIGVRRHYSGKISRGAGGLAKLPRPAAKRKAR
jgi:oligoendopeptidase F